MTGTIIVKHWNGDSFTIEANATEYMVDVKDKIQTLHNILISEQRLTWNRRAVDDCSSLEEQGVPVDGSCTLTLEPMKITVMLPISDDNDDGGGTKRVRLSITPEDTIKRIKKVVAKKASIKSELQVIVFQGKELHDGETLAACNVAHGDVLTVENYEIHVTHWDGEVISVPGLSPKDTLDHVKKFLLEKEGIPKDQQTFRYGKKLLNDFLGLKDQNIKHNALLRLDTPKHDSKTQLSPAADGTKKTGPQKTSLAIKHWNGTTFPVEMDPAFYLDDLKEKILELEAIPVDQQRLTLDGEPVDDCLPLVEQNITAESTLVLEAMKITVMLPPDGVKKLRISVVPDDNIKRIKRLVSKKAGIPQDDLVVVFNGTELSDGKSISDCHILHGDTLTVQTFVIHVTHWSGDLLVITDISPNDTITDLKRLLADKHRVPEGQQKYTFSGRGLNDFLALKDQQIKHKSVLCLEEPKEPKCDAFKMTIVLPTPEKPIEAKAASASALGTSDATISVQHWKGEIFTVPFDPTEYSEDLKEKIREIQSIPVDHQRLTLDGILLEDGETLKEQNVTVGATLLLEAMEIHVMLPGGKKKIRFNVHPDDRIQRIKRVISKESGIQPDGQCLTFWGKELDDTQTVSECQIVHDDVLTVETFAIQVCHWSGDIFVLSDIQSSDTIDDVKNIILKRKRILKSQQKLRFDGRRVDESKSLKDQQIKHQSMLVMEDTDIIKSPRPTKNTISEIKYIDTSEEESLLGGSDDSDDDDNSEGSELEEVFAANLVFPKNDNRTRVSS